MAIAGTKVKTKLTLQSLEEMVRTRPGELKSLNLSDPVTSELLSRLISVDPALRKALVESGVIGANGTALVGDRSLQTEQMRVAAYWMENDRQEAAAISTSNGQGTSGISTTISNVYQSVTSSVSNAWDATKDWAAGAWENTKQVSANLMQNAAGFITNTIPNFFTKTIPNALQQGWNRASSAVTDTVKTISTALSKAANTATASVIYGVRATMSSIAKAATPVVTLANAITTSISNLLSSGREWAAQHFSGPKNPAIATAVAVAALSVTSAVQPHVQPQTSTAKSAVVTSATSQRPDRNSLRVQSVAPEKPKASIQQTAQTPARRNPNRVMLRVSGVPLESSPSVKPVASQVVANAAARVAQKPVVALRRLTAGMAPV